MRLNDIQKQYDDRFEQIQFLLNYIKWAETNHLDIEFLDSFLQEFHHTGNILPAIKTAAREWDL